VLPNFETFRDAERYYASPAQRAADFINGLQPAPAATS
jgi:hypothetical protein